MTAIAAERTPFNGNDELMPMVLPHNWAFLRKSPGGDGFIAFNRGIGISVLVTFAVERDGERWMHLSLARRDNRIPTYEDMALVRAIFIRRDLHAYQVFPAADEYVNEAPVNGGKEVLHLWVPIGHRPLPDFRVEGEDGRLSI